MTRRCPPAASNRLYPGRQLLKDLDLAALYSDRGSSNATIAKIDNEDWSITLKVVPAARLSDREAEALREGPSAAGLGVVGELAEKGPEFSPDFSTLDVVHRLNHWSRKWPSS